MTWKPTAWYLYCEGKKPIEVYNNKEAAIAKCVEGQHLTDKEEKDVKNFLADQYPSFNRPVLVTGFQGEPDRTVTRIVGPNDDKG